MPLIAALDYASEEAARRERRRGLRIEGNVDLDEGQRQALTASVVVRREEDAHDVGALERAKEMALREADVPDLDRAPLAVARLAELDARTVWAGVRGAVARKVEDGGGKEDGGVFGDLAPRWRRRLVSRAAVNIEIDPGEKEALTRPDLT